MDLHSYCGPSAVPRIRSKWQKSGPTVGLTYLVKDLLGLTDDRAGFVNLSDGRHFDNLGIYELVRRRCRFIVACDAEEDGGFKFGALGNAIRTPSRHGRSVVRRAAIQKLSQAHCTKPGTTGRGSLKTAPQHRPSTRRESVKNLHTKSLFLGAPLFSTG